MVQKQRPPVLDDLDRHYLFGTKPQEPLSFSVRIRRMHPWWPGSESHGRVIDRLILLAVLTPGIIWLAISFGWIPVLFVVSEIIAIWLTVYRVLTGKILDDF